MGLGKRQAGSLEKKMLRIKAEYLRVHDCDVIDPDKVAEWAIRTRRYRREPPTIYKLFKRDLTRAMRNEYYRDPQGREVRLNHPVRGEQTVFWVNIQTATPKQMRASFAARRHGILADCRQCSLDFESFNQNDLYGARLDQMDFNFNPDLEELRKPTDYPDEKPD